MRIALILLLVLIASYISLPNEFALFGRNFVRPNLDLKIGKLTLKKNFDLALGLDLAGGSHLVFEAETKELSPERARVALESLKEVIERRVNLFGVNEPTVLTSSFEGKDRIIVELPGVRDTSEAVNLIGQTAELVFSEVVPEGTESARLVPTELTGAFLEQAEVSFDQTSGKPVVSLRFDKEGGEKFAQITERNIDKILAIVLDNQVVETPVVREKIEGGSAVISGDFSLDTAKKLAIQLNAGALPLKVTLVEERTVGATLGAESVRESMEAGLIGLSAVLIFMILAYGRLGIIADFGLIIFGVLTLALYKLIPVTLTLPGIAGFLLSVGMAVDSNILIFERFKEEKDKRSLYDALEISFGRAWDSIRDANVATLFIAFILANPFDWQFLHTSGPVRGFAITLALGIGISLFTGIVVSRNLLRMFVRK